MLIIHKPILRNQRFFNHATRILIEKPGWMGDVIFCLHHKAAAQQRIIFTLLAECATSGGRVRWHLGQPDEVVFSVGIVDIDLIYLTQPVDEEIRFVISV